MLINANKCLDQKPIQLLCIIFNQKNMYGFTVVEYTFIVQLGGWVGGH